jgi:hypothetical protein
MHACDGACPTLEERLPMNPDPGADDATPPSPAREALSVAIRALDDAELRQRPVDMVQALAQVGLAYRALDEPQAAAWYLTQALRWARTLAGVDASIELLCHLAEVEAGISLDATADGDRHGARAARDRARDHGYEAAGLARQCADPRWEAQVLLRVSEMLERCGDHDDALALQRRAVLLAGRSAGVTSLPEPHAKMPRAAM